MRRGGALLLAGALVACASGGGNDSPVALPPTTGSWQWQLTGTTDLTVNVRTYDLDGERTTAADVRRLHDVGRYAVCYVDAGAWEPYRPDAAAFPQVTRGKPLDGFPDERWLDIRRLDLLAAPLAARLDECRAKGFDAVEPDDVDGYTEDSGFPLTGDDTITFVRWLAAQAHARGLAVALKNDLDQAPTLAPVVDFAVVKQCVEYDECDLTTPFTAAGKPVLEAEYTGDLATICPVAARYGLTTIRKNVDLDATRQACPAPVPGPPS